MLQSDGVEKQWRACILRFCEGQDFRLLTFEQTQRRLDEVLVVKVPGSPSNATFRLEDFSQKKVSFAQSRALLRLGQQLVLLKTRANPILRPIIAEYEEIAEQLAAGKNLRATERLARLRGLRAKLASRMDKIDDCMNWFEATQARTNSGVFANYLDSIQSKSEAAPRRRDPISVYLDSIEEQFHD